MKKALFGFSVLVLVGCGSEKPTPPAPPVPPPGLTSFTLTGKHIEVTGTLNLGAKVSLDSAKSAVRSAITILEE